MLVSDEQAKSRLSNPLNLVNRLTSGVASPAPSANRSSTAMSLFGLSPSARNNPSTPPDKIKDIEAKKTKFTFNIKLIED